MKSKLDIRRRPYWITALMRNKDFPRNCSNLPLNRAALSAVPLVVALEKACSRRVTWLRILCFLPRTLIPDHLLPDLHSFKNSRKIFLTRSIQSSCFPDDNCVIPESKDPHKPFSFFFRLDFGSLPHFNYFSGSSFVSIFSESLVDDPCHLAWFPLGISLRPCNT